MAKPFMENEERTGVVIDGRPGLNGERGEQARLRRLGRGHHEAGKFELTASAAPGTFPVSIVVEQTELDALLDFAADGDVVIRARRQGGLIERNRVIVELRRYAEEVAKGIPAHVGYGFSQIVTGAIETILSTGEESDRADVR